MSWFSTHWDQFDDVSVATTWKLVDTLFQQQTTLLLGAVVFAALGLIGFIGTGSPWYFVGLVYASGTYALRLTQTCFYARARHVGHPDAWVWHSLLGGWLTALGWGAWSAVVLAEPEKTLVILVIGVQSACVIGAAVRNNAVRVIAAGQIFLTLTPLLACCLLADGIYMNVYAAFVAVHIVAALELTRFLNQKTLRLLRQDEEKSALVASLEATRQELEVINQHLKTLAATDALTGVANRRAFDLEAVREWRRCAREQAPLSLLLLDVDHFKAFNDFYGHQAGDDCLREVATTVASAVHRPGDLLARYGGEEFAVILPRTDLDSAVVIAEQMRAAILARALIHDASEPGVVSISIGAACLTPGPETRMEQLTALADAALYTAKRSGRNRVHAAATQAAAIQDQDLRMFSDETAVTTTGEHRDVITIGQLG
jgi:diguanylate cyclase (GGDEF)-like protein